MFIVALHRSQNELQFSKNYQKVFQNLSQMHQDNQNPI